MRSGVMYCASAVLRSRCARWRRCTLPGAPPARSRPRPCGMTEQHASGGQHASGWDAGRQEVVLSARGVWRSFHEGSSTLDVLTGVELSVARGERLAIIGASGSGKTTLLQILGGLDRPDAGVVEVAGRNIHALAESERSSLRNRTIGFVYQFHHLLPEFSALENVAMPLLVRRERTVVAAARARELLARVGLSERLHHRPHQDRKRTRL